MGNYQQICLLPANSGQILKDLDLGYATAFDWLLVKDPANQKRQKK